MVWVWTCPDVSGSWRSRRAHSLTGELQIQFGCESINPVNIWVSKCCLQKYCTMPTVSSEKSLSGLYGQGPPQVHLGSPGTDPSPLAALATVLGRELSIWMFFCVLLSWLMNSKSLISVYTAGVGLCQAPSDQGRCTWRQRRSRGHSREGETGN